MTYLMFVRRFYLVIFALLVTAMDLQSQQVTPAQYGALDFRHIGPVGNRATSVAGIAGDRFTYYLGAATGGVWKTEDAGLHWRPIFDDQPVHSIGALAVSPSDPAIVWAGTGETSIRSNVSIGNGVWRSTDAGDSWTHVGLEGTGRIGRIVVHPRDPDVAWVAALGHAYAPSPGRGVYRTTDGGQTWEMVLHVDDNTGAYEIVIDPSNPRKLMATMWQLDLKQWGRESGGPGSGIFVTKDGGDNWERLVGRGLPTRPTGKTGLCTTPDDPRTVYALIETGDGVPIHGEETDSGELWRTEDGGESWTLVSYHHDLATRQAYYTRCGVSVDDRDEVYFLSSSFSKTLDGGFTHTTTNFLSDKSSPGWDFHDIWQDPTDGDRFALAFDGGLAVTENRGGSWFRIQLPIAQMYHVTVDDAVPYNVLGNRQDGPSFRGPSNTRTGGLWANGIIPRGEWRAVGGGESGFATPDPEDPNIVWSSASGSGARGGIVVRYDARIGQFRDVEVWPMSTGGVAAADVRYRFQWTFPLLISPHDRNTIYVTSQHVHRTRNGGQSWDEISPDLTTNDVSKQGISGGLTPDNIGVEYCCVIYAFDESPVQEGVLWTGSNDGLVHVTRDGGGSWVNVTSNIPDLPVDGVVRSIDASRWSAGKAYVTIEHHQVGDFAPRAYKTEDFGATWTKIVAGVDNDPVDYTRYLLEDPVRPGLLYLGTESTLYVSFDDGGRWQPFMNGLPPTPYYGIVVQERFNDLVLGTYGRGFWILDDLGPLQQLTDEVTASAAHLFEPRDAYRFRPLTEPMINYEDWTHGENPEPGASLSYWLGEEPDGAVELRIDNTMGETVRTLQGDSDIGINRIWWDLQGEVGTQIRLRTKPLFADWFSMPDQGWRSGGRVNAQLQPPGTYTVTLLVNSEERGSETLEVLKDPSSEGSLAEIRVQAALLAEIASDQERAAAAVNQVELVRRQLYDLRTIVDGTEHAEEVDSAVAALDDRLIAVEGEIVQLKSTGGGDGVRWPSMIFQQLGYLRGGIGNSDFRPTAQHTEVQGVLRQRLAVVLDDLAALIAGDVARFNQRVVALGLAPVIVS